MEQADNRRMRAVVHLASLDGDSKNLSILHNSTENANCIKLLAKHQNIKLHPKRPHSIRICATFKTFQSLVKGFVHFLGFQTFSAYFFFFLTELEKIKMLKNAVLVVTIDVETADILAF